MDYSLTAQDLCGDKKLSNKFSSTQLKKSSRLNSQERKSKTNKNKQLFCQTFYYYTYLSSKNWNLALATALEYVCEVPS